MTIDRDQMRSDAELGRRLTGTYQADSDPDYYRAMGRIFESVPELLDALDQTEGERDELVRKLVRADDAARSEGFVPVADYDARESQWRGYEESLRDQIARETNRAEQAEALNTDEIRALVATASHTGQTLLKAAEALHSVKLSLAEARLQAVRDVLDRAEQRHENAVLFNGASFPAICSAPDIRRALDGDT